MGVCDECVVFWVANTYSLIVFPLSNGKWGRPGCNPGPLIRLHERESGEYIHSLKHLSFCRFPPTKNGKINTSNGKLWGVFNLRCCLFYWIFTSALLCTAGLTSAVCLIWNNWCLTKCATPLRFPFSDKWSEEETLQWMFYSSHLSEHTCVPWDRYSSSLIPLLLHPPGGEEGVAPLPETKKA